MAHIFTFLTSFFVFINSATPEIPYLAIEESISSNNASEFVSFGKEKILLNILGNEGAYSTSQATLVLRDFFVKKPGDSFKFIFKGKETAEGSFAIGTYQSKSENFRFTIQFKKINLNFKIESLTIEKS